MPKRSRNSRFVGFWGSPALKSDLHRIALAESRTLSSTVCGLLRLGLTHYFLLAEDSQALQRLKSKIQELKAVDGLDVQQPHITKRAIKPQAIEDPVRRGRQRLLASDDKLFLGEEGSCAIFPPTSRI